MPWGECRKMDERIRPDLRSFPPVIFHPESAKLRAMRALPMVVRFTFPGE